MHFLRSSCTILLARACTMASALMWRIRALGSIQVAPMATRTVSVTLIALNISQLLVFNKSVIRECVARGDVSSRGMELPDTH